MHISTALQLAGTLARRGREQEIKSHFNSSKISYLGFSPSLWAKFPKRKFFNILTENTIQLIFSDYYGYLALKINRVSLTRHKLRTNSAVSKKIGFLLYPAFLWNPSFQVLAYSVLDHHHYRSQKNI